MRRPLLLPLVLLAAGVLAGRFVWTRPPAITSKAKEAVSGGATAAARAEDAADSSPGSRPAQPELAKRWDLLQRLRKITAAECPALWEELAAGPEDEEDDENPWNAEQLMLAQRWAELDPAGAYGYLVKKKGISQLMGIVFRAWVRTNEEAALGAAVLQFDPVKRGAALAGIFSVAAEDPAKIITWGRRFAGMAGKDMEASDFDSVIPVEALRRAFESDPARLREIGANMPSWFQRRLEAFVAAKEMAGDVPAALARIDAVGLTKRNASAFVGDMLPQLEAHPDKLVMVMEHLNASLGKGWLASQGTESLPEMLTAVAKATPEKVRAILTQAGYGQSFLAVVQLDAAADLFATDPRLALQLAPAGDTWMSEFMSGALLPPDSGSSPQEALDLVRTAPSTTMRNGLLQQALAALMKNSPESAAAWVAGLPPGELQDTARVTLEHPEYSRGQAELERAAVSAAHGGDAAASMELVRKTAQRQVQTDPAAAVAQIQAWPANEARDTALEGAGRAWGEKFTPDALAWAESLPADAQPRALAGVMEAWGAGEPAEASEYLSALAPGAARDAPAAGFARGYAEVDPGGALQWAATVQDAALRQATLMEVAGRWLAKNPGAAQKGLQALPGLTDAERAQLLKAPPP